MKSAVANSTDSSNHLGASIPPSTMPLVSPPALLQAYLQQSPPSRPSERTPLQTRPIQVNTGSLTHCNGSSVVKMGNTSIVCGVRAEILPVHQIPHHRIAKSIVGSGVGAHFAEHGGSASKAEIDVEEEDDDNPETEGSYEAVTLNNLLVPNLELGTGCAPIYPANVAPSPTAQSISQRILSLLHSSRLIRTKDLEIKYTPAIDELDTEKQNGLDPDDPAYVEPEKEELKAYWVLYIDMICISADGGLFEAAWLALYAALKDAILPKAWWDRDERQIFCSSDITKGKSLKVRGCPVGTGFGAFAWRDQKEGEKHEMLIDIDSFEEGVCEEQGCIVIDGDDRSGIRILRVEKNGGGLIDGEDLRDTILPTAKKRWKEWKDVLAKSQA